MAENIRRLAKTDLGLAVTGIAGPKGATSEKPVGLVYIALASSRKLQCREFYFHGEREAVRRGSSQAALDMLRRQLILREFSTPTPLPMVKPSRSNLWIRLSWNATCF